MSSAERRNSVERFDYSRVGADWAVVRLLARLGFDAGSGAGSLPGAAGPVMAAPAAKIVVSREGIDPQTFPARVCMLERRLRGGRREAGSDLLWRAAFALPLELVECREAQFSVTAAGLAMELPTPGLRIVTPRGLELAPAARRQSATRPVIQTRHRLAALATAVVVTAGSTPAAFAADLGAPSNGAPSGAPAGSPATSTSVTTSTSASSVAASTTPASSSPGPAAPAPATTTPSASPAPDGSPASSTPSTTPTSSTATASTPAAPTPAPATPAPATTTTATATPAPAASATTSAAPPVTTQPAAVPTAQPAVHTDTAKAPAKSHAKASTHRAATTSTSSTGHKRARLGRVQVVHLFTSKRRAAHGHGGGANLILSNCSSAAGAGAIAYAAAQFTAAETTGRTLHVHCPAPSDASAASTSGGHGASAPQGSTLTINNPGAPAPKTGTPAPTSTPSAPTGTSASSAGAAPAAPHAEHPSSSPVAPRARAPRTPASTKQRTGGAALTTLGSTPAPPAPGTTISTLSSTPPGFTGPTAWTGTVAADPALTGAVTDLSGLLANGDRPPSFLIPIYMQAGHRYGVPWEVLAAINAIESDYGRDLNTSSAGALGWMQFEPSTWREWGVAADGHSVPNPYDPRDAIFSAARYLAAAGAGANIAQAVYAYNHAGWYVSEVLSRASAIAGHAQFERETVNRGTFSVYFATGVRKHPTIRYRSAVLSHYDRLIAAANMVSAANFPYVWGGGHEQPAQFAPFDCSGSVSYVLQQAGYKVPTTTSGSIPVWKFPTGPGRVTIFYNATHTFMRIGNRYFGTSGFARPGTGGAGWFDVSKLPVGYLAGFNEVHVPHLGVNSFAAPAQASAATTVN